MISTIYTYFGQSSFFPHLVFSSIFQHLFFYVRFFLWTIDNISGYLAVISILGFFSIYLGWAFPSVFLEMCFSIFILHMTGSVYFILLPSVINYFVNGVYLFFIILYPVAVIFKVLLIPWHPNCKVQYVSSTSHGGCLTGVVSHESLFLLRHFPWKICLLIRGPF